MSKSVLFSLLAVGCVWLILDNFYGKKLVDKLAKKLTKDNKEYVMNEEEKKVDTKSMDGLVGDAVNVDDGGMKDNLYAELTPDEQMLVMGHELGDAGKSAVDYIDSIRSENLYLDYLKGNLPSSVKDGELWVK